MKVKTVRFWAPPCVIVPDDSEKPTHPIRDSGEIPLFVSPVPWNRENILTLLPLLRCTQCGDCCRTATPIAAQEYEVERIARFLGYKPRKFKRAWKRRDDGIYWVPDKPCMFLDGNKCSIYPVRMVVCKYCPMRRVSIQGQECIAVSGYCNAGSECIRWLRDKSGNAIS